MAKPNKKEFEKGLQESGYVRRGGTKRFPDSYHFEHSFGRYSLSTDVFYPDCDKEWSLTGWCELTPKTETPVDFERKYTTYDIDEVKKAEVEFARHVKNKVIPFLLPAGILPKGLEALLRK